MGTVIAFPQRAKTVAFGPDDYAALDRLVGRTKPAGAVRWEVDDQPVPARAYILGAEDETLLIVTKTRAGITINSGYAPEPLWRGDRLAGY